MTTKEDNIMQEKVEVLTTTLDAVRSIPQDQQVSFSAKKFDEIAKAMTEGMDVNLELIKVVRKNEESNRKTRWLTILSMLMTVSLFGLILVRSQQLVTMRHSMQNRIDKMQDSVSKMQMSLKRTNRVNKSIALAVGAGIEIDVKKPGFLDPVEAEDAQRKAVAAQLEAVEAIVADEPSMDSDPVIDRVRNKAALMNIRTSEQPVEQQRVEHAESKPAN